MDLNKHFETFRGHVIGDGLGVRSLTIKGPAGITEILYADWTASGRLYRPIEKFLSEQVGSLVANTHTESNFTGTAMTQCYREARNIIKRHVNAGPDDILIAAGSGMTAVVNKLQRMLGLRVPDVCRYLMHVGEDDKPLVLITHMEHHSNQTTWQECNVTLEIVNAGLDGLPDLEHLENLLQQYRTRKLKIGAFTACSNVTGITTPYYAMAEVMHKHGGICFVDFSASAPYVAMDMQPKNPLQKLDAIYFSPHKFLGGPGSSGILIFDKALYACRVPDQPGGGTVSWTNPWGEHRFFDDIETREDGGTPPFLQTIKAALACKVKEAMGVANIALREHRLVTILLEGLAQVPGLHILGNQEVERLCIVSFYVSGIHHNLIVRVLNDRFGIQVRGGCSCAGTYGHFLLAVDPRQSAEITNKIDQGDLSDKPGWVRISLHPTNTEMEARFIVSAVHETVAHIAEWSRDYRFDSARGEFIPLFKQPQLLSLRHFIAIPPVQEEGYVNLMESFANTRNG